MCLSRVSPQSHEVGVLSPAFLGRRRGLGEGKLLAQGQKGQGQQRRDFPSKAFATCQKDAARKLAVLRSHFLPHQEGCSQPLYLRPHPDPDALRDSLFEHLLYIS